MRPSSHTLNQDDELVWLCLLLVGSLSEHTEQQDQQQLDATLRAAAASAVSAAASSRDARVVAAALRALHCIATGRVGLVLGQPLEQSLEWVLSQVKRSSGLAAANSIRPGSAGSGGGGSGRLGGGSSISEGTWLDVTGPAGASLYGLALVGMLLASVDGAWSEGKGSEAAAVLSAHLPALQQAAQDVALLLGARAAERGSHCGSAVEGLAAALVAAGADTVNALDKEGFSPLHRFAAQGDCDLAFIMQTLAAAVIPCRGLCHRSKRISRVCGAVYQQSAA